MKLVQAVFERKPDCLGTTTCQIEKVVELSAEEYKAFSEHLYRDQTFIEENVDLMYYDSKGIRHCLLILGEGEEDGILVESEGAEYARYAAHLSGARQYVQMEQYPSLSLYQQEMIEIVERCVEPLLKRQEHGIAKLHLSEIRRRTIPVEFSEKLFLRMLSDRPEFDRACLDYDHETVEVTINEDYIHEDMENIMRM